MSCSPEQLAANRRNAQKSTGPRTEGGKARSRANGLKHGLTGQGVVVHPQDAAEVDRRSLALEADLRPSNEWSLILVQRVAALSVRLERSVRQEIAAVAERVRDADRDYVEARDNEVEALLAATATDPSGATRKLRQTPEGIDALTSALLGLRSDLDGRWDSDRIRRLEDLMGRAFDESPKSRARAIGQACWGYFAGLKPEDGAELSADERTAWARASVARRIDGEVEELRATREALDLDAFKASRLEAPDRALFDPSKEAEKARRYEAATERAMFRSIREFRESEAAQAVIDATPEAETPSEESASCCPAEPEPAPVPPGPTPAPVAAPPRTIMGWADNAPRAFPNPAYGHPGGLRG